MMQVRESSRVRRALRAGVLAGLVALALPATVRAQAAGRGERVSERVQGARPAVERLAAVVQRRLGLNAEQAAQLRTTTRRFATEREELLRKERVLRRTLRDEVQRGAAADQSVVERQLDDLLAVQRRRVELVAAEQRELARFLTPMQRAEFLALQERAFRAAQQLRQTRDREFGPRGSDPPRLKR